MKVRKKRAVRALLTAELMFVLIGAVGSGVVTGYTPAHADEQRCQRCGNLGAQCKSGCGHTLSGCTCKVFTEDKGPSTISESVLASYPQPVRETYEKLFSKRCSKCHTLARPINRDFPPSKWEEYIKKMMHKPGSGIHAAEAKRIWQFLVFDTAKRKGSYMEKMPESEREIVHKVVHECQGGS